MQQQQQSPFANSQQSTTAPHGTAAGTAPAAATPPQSIQPPLTHFGSTEPMLLADMSFAELDAAIDHELLRNRDRLIPYLREMRSRFDKFQGTRNDLHPDTPQIGWQAWVESKKAVVGSLATVKRLLAAPKDPPAALTPLQDAVVKALIAQGYKKKDAVVMTKAAEGEDFDTLFRSALRSANGEDDDESPESEEEQPDEGSPDDEKESEEPENKSASEKTTEVKQDQLAGPQIAELQKEIAELTAENASLTQRLAALQTVPEHLRDDQITATLAEEPDSGIASKVLTAYLRTVVERVLPANMGVEGVSASVKIIGRDHRIMIGDYLQKENLTLKPGDSVEQSPILCKCTAIADYMQRRRVQEWSVNKWEKERVVYSGDESSYWVVTEARARELTPAAFEPPAQPSQSS